MLVRPVAPQVSERPSPGLDQFVSTLPDRPAAILDLSGVSQANIDFITGLGHRLYSDDMLQALESAFGEGADAYSNQSDKARIQRFMSSTLDFPVDTFGGALLWDSLQFLSPELLNDTLDQLYHIIAPGSSLVAYFHADERSQLVPLYSYRILNRKTVQIISKNRTAKAQYFNNRALEKIFSRFSSVKFFLSRDTLREVIVRR